MTLSVANVLQRPVPSQSVALSRKNGYREYPLRLDDERNNEPLVNIAAYDLAGQSYYSRPNAATGDAIPQVDPTVYVREGLVKRLAVINDTLRTSKEVAALFDGNVELYVEEGLRSWSTQSLLYNEVFPRLIRVQSPDLSEREVLERRDSMIARPSEAEASPSPHATGAAVDISMRYVQIVKSYVPGCEVFMGNDDADMSHTVRPDFFESPLSGTKQKLAQRNRRLFYWMMKGALCNEESGLCVNPTEWWHWSYGDQMWSATTSAPFAFYGSVKHLNG